MALPFDLREFASSADDGFVRGPSSREPRGASGRPSHAIVIAPSLVERIHARDVDAFRELVRVSYAPLVRFGRSIVQSRDDAEDVVQDVFTRVWDLGPRWNPTGDPVAYLFASVRNYALKEMRRRERAAHRARQALGAEVESPGAVIEETAGALDQVVNTEVDDERVRRVTAVLETLSERYRTVYELRYRRGLTVPSIAGVLGITLKSAEHLTSRVTRVVMERLQQRLAAGD